MYALHSHFRKTMLKICFEILFRKKMKKLTRQFEHIEISFDKSEKIRDFNSNKVRENRFLYKQSNVNNVSENDSVQSAISRDKSRNKNKER